MRKRIAVKPVLLATSAQLPDLAVEERPLLNELAARGIVARPAIWDDPGEDWANAALVVIRSTWDYHLKRDEFVAWAGRVEALSQLWNPAEAISWNSEKTYLRELARRGVPTIPTVWLEPGDRVDLARILADRGWADAVLKPTVSANAHRTSRVTPENLDSAQAMLERHLSEGGMMLQPYLAEVEGAGERSLVFIAGQATHAIRKVPALASQHPDLSAVEAVAIETDEEALALAVLEGMPWPLLYARVDLVRSAEGLKLMELEVIEPSLFLNRSDVAAARLAEAIAERLSR